MRVKGGPPKEAAGGFSNADEAVVRVSVNFPHFFFVKADLVATEKEKRIPGGKSTAVIYTNTLYTFFSV